MNHLLPKALEQFIETSKNY